jgi:DNA-binding MarR family transcriptional regulator
MLLRLEDRGLVAREQHPTDGRARCVTLTRKGKRTYERLWAQGEPLRQRMLAAFEPEEAEVLVELLTRIPAAVEMKGRRPAASVVACDS